MAKGSCSMDARPPRLLHRRSIIVIGGIFLLTIAAIIVTAVAAQSTGTKATVRPYIASLPPEKQTAVAPAETKTAEYIRLHPEAGQMPPRETPGPLPLGIDGRYPDGWNMKFHVENEWYGNINGARTSV